MARLSLETLAYLLSAPARDGGAPHLAPHVLWLIEQVPESRELWEQMQVRADGVPSMWDLARAVCAVDGRRRCPEAQATLIWLVSRVPSVLELWEQLEQTVQDADESPDHPAWLIDALHSTRQVDRLLSVDGWTEPAEVLDPTREVGIDYAPLIKTVTARMSREPDPAVRERLAAVRSRLQSTATSGAGSSPAAGRPLADLKSPGGEVAADSEGMADVLSDVQRLSGVVSGALSDPAVCEQLESTATSGEVGGGDG